MARPPRRGRDLRRAPRRVDQRRGPLRRRDLHARVVDHAVRPRRGARALSWLARGARAGLLGQRVWYKWALYDRDPIPRWTSGVPRCSGTRRIPCSRIWARGLVRRWRMAACSPQPSRRCPTTSPPRSHATSVRVGRGPAGWCWPRGPAERTTTSPLRWPPGGVTSGSPCANAFARTVRAVVPPGSRTTTPVRRARWRPERAPRPVVPGDSAPCECQDVSQRELPCIGHTTGRSISWI